MNKRKMRVFISTIIALLGATIGSNAFADFTIERIVRCDRGMNVQDVLDRNIWGLPMELKLVGPCTGFDLKLNDVVIRPQNDNVCPGATVTSTIFMNDAQRIEIRCIRVSSEDGSGIDAQRSSAMLEDVDLLGNDGAGLESTDSSRIEMIRGSIAENSESGALVDSKGTAAFEGTRIVSNGGNGIDATQNTGVSIDEGWIMNNSESGIRLESISLGTVSNTTISNNGSAGVAVRSGSRADLRQVNIMDNDGSGLILRENSTATVLGGLITGNGRDGIFLTWHALVRIFQGTEIMSNTESGIQVRRDSGAQIGTGTVIPPNGSGLAIECDDKESSIDLQAGAGVDPAFIDCEDPEF